MRYALADDDDMIDDDLDLEAFFDLNAPVLTEEEVTAIRALLPGQTFHGGGGAASAWRIDCTEEDDAPGRTKAAEKL